MAKKKDKKLRLTVKYLSFKDRFPEEKAPGKTMTFECAIEGAAIKAKRYEFHVTLFDLIPLSNKERWGGVPILGVDPINIQEGPPSPIHNVKDEKGVRSFEFVEEFKPILEAIQNHRFSENFRPTKDGRIPTIAPGEGGKLPRGQIWEGKLSDDYIELLKFFYPDDPARKSEGVDYFPDFDNKISDEEIARAASELCSHFGGILKRILEGVGYDVEIEISKYYFPSPTSTALLTPAFGLGLQKEISPIDIKKGYEDIIIYLSREKPKSKVQVQINMLDSIPEERLANLQRAFKDSLSPYGLKSLYLVIEECNQNNRNSSFSLDINRCLDLMGYKRKKDGVHKDKNKKRLLQELETQTRINFNVEARAKIKGKRGIEEVLKFEAPLLSITGKFEKWEVKEGRPAEEGIKIQDGIHIFIHPAIYNYINEGWYTVLPHKFLKIDTSKKGHALNLYSYIANQWRMGWSQCQGIMKQPMNQILDGAGLLHSWPKRRNQQRDFIKKVIEHLRWLKSQKEFWIKSVKVETRNRSPFDPMVTIAMADDHPLRSSMEKR